MEELRQLLHEALQNPAVFMLKAGLYGILAAFMTFATMLPLILSAKKNGG